MERPVKVLFFLDGVGNGGGIQEMVIRWVQHIDRSRVAADLLAFRFGPIDNYEERFRACGGNTQLLPAPSDGFLRSYRALKEFFRAHAGEYDILHVHGSSKLFYVLALAKKYGVPVRILHNHANRFQDRSPLKTLLGNFLKLPARHYANRYYTCSMQAGVWMFGRRAAKAGKIRVIPNAIETSPFRFDEAVREKTRAALGIGEQTLVVGSVGRIKRQKNHAFLLDVFAVLKKEHPDAVLLIAGRGVLEEQVRAKTKALGLENDVRFLGVRNDVPALLQAFDILVMPSVFEGLPVVGVEAQAASLPCLFSDAITEEAVLLDSTERLSLTEPPEIWARRITTLASCGRTSDAEQRLSEQGYEIGEAAKALEALYLREAQTARARKGETA